ncbi:MAG: glycosyltransferase family 39 protein [Thermoanaerobaculia bacterium]|nr:glycosyltransferase family 39 protein [Thermoanaerobaculia bacterium]
MPQIPVSLRVPTRIALLLLIATGVTLHVVVFWIAHFPEPRQWMGDEPMYLEGGQTLASGQTWSYESLWPPFQPVFLALILRLTGGSLLAVEIVQTLLLLLAAYLLSEISRSITGSRQVGWISGSLMLIYPTFAGFAHFLWPEILHLTAYLATGWILLHRRHSFGWLFGAGLLLGVTLSSKYLLWPLLLVALPILLFRVRKGVRRRLAIVASGALMVLGIVYSSDRLQVKKYPMVESAVFNAWVGLHDTSRKDFVDPIVGQYFRRYIEAPSVRERNELMWAEIVAEGREVGWLRLLARQAGRQYFRLLDKDTFLTDQLPGGVIAESGRGFQGTPRHVAKLLKAWSYGLYGAVLVLATVGAIVFPIARRSWSRALLSVLGFALLVFLVSHVKSRFRLQFEPILFLYTGCAVSWIAARIGWTSDEIELWDRRPGTRQWLAAAAVASVLLFLAFGRPLL